MDSSTPQRYLPRLTAMAAAALAVAGGILASDAHAQSGFCKQEAYYTSSGYVYRRCGVPDFDQKRLGDLPDDGAVHCVPTSTINWMAYIADRGLGLVKPGPGLTDSTPSASQYDAISDAIQDLGVLMNVSVANGGTNAGNWQTGTREWLAQSLGGISSPACCSR
ncbi:MAG TPA: hypothetical protein VJM11_03900 [Nevskiaceae bacterium]|nr:hypothetical protein [Nevskiaceae bacterium]